MKVIVWGIATMLFVSSLVLCRNIYKSVSPKIEALQKQYSEFNTTDIQLASQVLDESGKLIATTGPVMRLPVRSENLPPHVVHAFLAAEDVRFFGHFGVSPLGILRAAFINLKAGQVVQGASTITQQLAKLLFLTSERSMTRKFHELVMALTIEQSLSKREILDLYLTTIYFGRGAYGLEAASRAYFDKPAKLLTVSEAALLAGIPKSPTRYAPSQKNTKRSEWRRMQVLTLMREASFLDDTIWKTAGKDSPKVQTYWRRIGMPISFLREIPKEVTQYLPVDTLGDGIKIKSTFSSSAQEKLNALIAALYGQLPQRMQPAYEVAGLSLAYTGEISALKSSHLEDQIYYNFALQMKRPLGALAIPVIAELAFRDGAGWGSSVRYWENDKHSVKQSLLQAMKEKDYFSMSGVVDQVGVTGVIQTLKRAGIHSKYNDIRAAAGFDQVSLLQIARLGTIWASFGKESPSGFMISRIDGFRGKNYYFKKPFTSKQALPSASSQLLLAGLMETSPCGKVNCYASYDPKGGNLHLMFFGKKAVSVVWLGGKTGETLELSAKQLDALYKAAESIYESESQGLGYLGSGISYLKKAGLRIPVLL